MASREQGGILPPSFVIVRGSDFKRDRVGAVGAWRMSKSPGQQTMERDRRRPARIDVSGNTLSKIGFLPLVVRLRQVQMRRTSNCNITVTGTVGTESSVGEVVASP